LTTIDAQFKAAPTGDPVGMTGTFGKPYETTDDDGNRVGVAEHIVAVTGVADEGGDVFVPGVFADAIRHGVKAIEREEWMPGDPRIAERIIPNLPAGVEWPSAAGAVYVKAEYNLNTPEGQRAYENAKFYGPEESFSVGYKVADGGARKRGGRRYIAKLAGWYEWSDVLHGMNKYAFGLSVKGLLDTELEYSDGRLVTGTEVKALRRVKNSAYWGKPIGSPIMPGDKPRGPQAQKLRKAGVTPDPEFGTTTKEPPGKAGGKTPDVPDAGMPDAGAVPDSAATSGDSKPQGDAAPDAAAVQGPSSDKPKTSTTTLASMRKRDATAAAAGMDDAELVDEASRAAREARSAQPRPSGGRRRARQAAGRYHTGRRCGTRGTPGCGRDAGTIQGAWRAAPSGGHRSGQKHARGRRCRR